MNYQWKILEVFAKDSIITGCRYHLTGSEDDISIETEGNFYFNEPSEKVPFLQVTEEMMGQWIEQEAVIDGENHIKMGIKKQLEALKSSKPVPAPWQPQIFKPEI